MLGSGFILRIAVESRVRLREFFLVSSHSRSSCRLHERLPLQGLKQYFKCRGCQTSDCSALWCGP